MDKEKNLDIVCMGMALIDCIIKGFDPEPISASGFRASSCSLNVGGEAVNEAMAAAKLGAKTGIVCALGKDAAGRMILSELEQCQVDTQRVRITDDHATPVTTMFVNEDGSRKSITNEAHRYNFHPEKQPELFTCAKAIILGSLFRAPFDDPDIILQVVKKAKEQGQLIFADTKLPNFRFLTLEDIKEALPYLDFITPNEDEAKHFTGREDPEEMAKVFLSYGVKNVIIKLGKKGCFFKNNAVSFSLPPCEIEAVDATGAGDNFVAAFAADIVRGASLEEALTFANSCGAICTTAVGAGTALKSRQQVERFMEEQKKKQAVKMQKG